nr:two-component response regulator-like APRR1 isoform X2 [Coffea arabica]
MFFFKKVTTAWSEMQIVNALNSDGPHTDIILAEVNLLMANGAEILRYIMHNKDLQHIPVIRGVKFYRDAVQRLGRST